MTSVQQEGGIQFRERVVSGVVVLAEVVFDTVVTRLTAASQIRSYDALVGFGDQGQLAPEEAVYEHKLDPAALAEEIGAQR